MVTSTTVPNPHAIDDFHDDHAIIGSSIIIGIFFILFLLVFIAANRKSTLEVSVLWKTASKTNAVEYLFAYLMRVRLMALLHVGLLILITIYGWWWGIVGFFAAVLSTFGATWIDRRLLSFSMLAFLLHGTAASAGLFIVIQSEYNDCSALGDQCHPACGWCTYNTFMYAVASSQVIVCAVGTYVAAVAFRWGRSLQKDRVLPAQVQLRVLPIHMARTVGRALCGKETDGGEVSLQEWNPSPSTKRLQDPLQVRRIDSLDPLDGSRGPQWERVVDPEGGVRFHNPSTGEVTQSPPSNMV